MTAHTPGPWVAEAASEYGVAISSEGVSIAAVWPERLAGQPLPLEANARLIAAAPDMYEALQLWRQGEESGDYLTQLAATDARDAAIAKATQA